MKKLILLAILSLMTTAAFAENQRCGVEGALNVKVFNLYTSNNVYVQLFDPQFNRTFSALCSHVPGAIELSLNCEVETSSESGYYVNIASIGSSALSASLRPWTMMGEEEPINRRCEEF